MTQRASEGDCGHVRSVVLSKARRNAALNAAERRCIAGGEVWSSSRRRTYELLLEDLKPCGAYDLIARFDPGGRPPGPPTIYRALDSLMRLGLVHRIKSEEKFIACTAPDPPHAAAFLICECCGRADEVADPDIRPALGVEEGFSIRTVMLELRGRCRSCRE